MQATRKNAVHRRWAVSARDRMHVKECIEAGSHNPGRVQLEICSVLHLAAASVQRAAGSVLSHCRPLALCIRILKVGRPRHEIVRDEDASKLHTVYIRNWMDHDDDSLWREGLADMDLRVVYDTQMR